jgi:putative cardiolipin synthase
MFRNRTLLNLAMRLGLSATMLTAFGCSSLPSASRAQKPASTAVQPRRGIVDEAFVATSPDPKLSAFHMLPVGVDGLAARLELIDAASSALDLQYYIFRGDESGTLVARALLRAADRGVRVRVLLDDGDTLPGDERLFALAAHPLIEIRVFNPFDYRGHVGPLRALDFMLHKHRLDHRMHNKLMVADNGFALIGGRNIGNQYFQIDPDSQFGDDDVAVYGPVVQTLSGVFDLFWNSEQAVPVIAIDHRNTSGEALSRFRRALLDGEHQTAFEHELESRIESGEPLLNMTTGRDPMLWSKARLVYDSPDKGAIIDGVASGKLIYAAVEQRAADVRHELLMITPYFVPAPADLSLLERERERHVSVRILTNSLESAPNLAAQSGYTHYRLQLLAAGVALHEIRASPEAVQGTGQPRSISRYGNYGLHAKLYVFDRESIFVGSMNFDQRSKRLNTEIGLIIDSAAMSAATARRFESLTQLSNSYAVSLGHAGNGTTPQLTWTTEHEHVVTEYTTEPARNRWQRWRMTLLSWLPLDGEL